MKYQYKVGDKVVFYRTETMLDGKRLLLGKTLTIRHIDKHHCFPYYTLEGAGFLFRDEELKKPKKVGLL